MCIQLQDDSCSEGGDNIDWNTDDELEIANISSSSSSVSLTKNEAAISVFEFGESSSSTNESSKLLHFTKMGFPQAMVAKVIAELGDDDTDAILDMLLTYSALDEIPHQEQELNDPIEKPESNFSSDFSDFDDSCSDEDSNEILEKDDALVCLIDMGYSLEEASTAITRCGKDVALEDLVDFLSAAHISKEADAQFDNRNSQKDNFWIKRKQLLLAKNPKRKRNDNLTLHLPNPMIGFGLPRHPSHVAHRPLPDANTITRFLYEIEPEFVDSKFLCAAARKRGYIHNLPLHNRFPIQPHPPRTIFEALPGTKKWWPEWDKREQLNCILTCVGSAKLTDRIRQSLVNSIGEPSEQVKKYVIGQCKKWNMVWTGKTRVAPLEPDEIESIMGFPISHTRGATRMERYKGLGNAFQVDTVAYHLSVLKKLYPNGINVLSLFSGIGGAEVALHKLGIRMKNVVSVEKSRVCESILRSWWEETNQTGNLIHVGDVEEVTYDKLEGWIGSFGGFDIVIGGSPCNNLAGGNRRTRDGLDGQHSSLFYDYFRILDAFKFIMSRR
ncbi:hypothetical protein LXL04_020877 [Taraxacum kok-saghyz]